MNVAYRAFYAIADLSTAAGRPTNAVYGFVKTMMQLERLWKPTHCLAVFDGGIPPERIELLTTYKAHRPAMPDSLREQLQAIKEYLDCASIASARLDGKEADDVIASVAAGAEKAGMEALVVTGDKDLMQIVDENVSILLPGKTDRKMGPAEVFSKTGVTPAQIVDWLALMGDSTDNIPGVPGVGAKTAARWLREWGSLDAIWEHLQELKPEKLSRSLVENKEAVARNVRMMRLDQDLDCLKSVDDAKLGPPDGSRLLRFFEQMEFHSLAGNLRAPALL